MKKKENIVVVDWDTPDNWKFKVALEKATEEKWIVLKSISNLNHGGIKQRIIRYLKYFSTPVKIFIRRDRFSRVLAWQQFYGLILAFYYRLLKVRNAPPIYVMTFIYKKKRGIVGRVYDKFMKYIVDSGYIEQFFVFSKSEPEYYSKIFGVSKDRFMPLNLGVADMTEAIPIASKGDYFISAGRSNRDYRFLIGVWKNRSDKLELICDCLDEESTDNIVVNNSCHDDAYFHKLAQSFAVIVPLEDAEISSGQLVIIQSMMYGKPCIVTENKAISDYIQNEYNGIIIKKELEALEHAIEKLRNPEFYSVLSLNARKCYLENYSDYAMGDTIGHFIRNKG